MPFADWLQVAAPMMLPVAGPDGHVRGNRGHAVFLNSRGDVTAYTFQGRQAWQVGRFMCLHNPCCLLQAACMLDPRQVHPIPAFSCGCAA